LPLGIQRLLQRQTSGALTVSTSPDFAAKWLVNRLGRFAEEHPSIDLRVSATLHHVDFAREAVYQTEWFKLKPPSGNDFALVENMGFGES